MNVRSWNTYSHDEKIFLVETLYTHLLPSQSTKQTSTFSQTENRLEIAQNIPETIKIGDIKNSEEINRLSEPQLTRILEENTEMLAALKIYNLGRYKPSELTGLVEELWHYYQGNIQIQQPETTSTQTNNTGQQPPEKAEKEYLDICDMMLSKPKSLPYAVSHVHTNNYETAPRLEDIREEGDIDTFNVRQLRSILSKRNIDFSGVVERFDLIDIVRELYKK